MPALNEEMKSHYVILQSGIMIILHYFYKSWLEVHKPKPNTILGLPTMGSSINLKTLSKGE